MAEYLIWSFEHNAWWGPNEVGYVKNIEKAGRYSLAGAERICLAANTGSIDEAIVPLPETRIPASLPTGYEPR
jgi:hypothetical protein